MLYNRTLLFIYFIYSSVYLLIPSSYLSLPPSQFGNYKFVFLCLWICFCFVNKFICFIYLFIFAFLGPHLQHMEVPQLQSNQSYSCLADTTATATQGLDHICDLHHSSQQCQSFNPLSEARDQIRILMDTSWVHNPLSHKRNSLYHFFRFHIQKISYDIFLSLTDFTQYDNLWVHPC